MNDKYVIYNKKTGDVHMMIKTEDPMIILLNTPPDYEAIKTDMENFGEIKSVDVKTKKLKLKAQN